MAYVPGCMHDIFVSYAHVDNEIFPDQQKGWVSTLVECLQKKLAQLLGRSDCYSLWIDSALSRHVKFTPQIVSALEQTAVMVVVLSPGYLASEWCNREKKTFLDLFPCSHSRVFLVERDDIEPEERPEVFSELLGFRFWVREGERSVPRTLGEFGLHHDADKYYPQINELGRALAFELKRLKKEREQNAGSGVSKKQETVFLAEVTDDLEQERENVKSYLLQAGIAVLPRTCFSQDPVKFKACVERDLAESLAFVQLLSGVAGKKPPDLPQGYVKLQLEAAVRAGKELLQWRNPLLDLSTIADKDHLAIVDGEKVRAEGIEDFKRAVKDTVLREEKSEVYLPPVDAFVFVNMDTADRVLAEKVCNYLEQKEIGYSLPLEEGDPSDVREVFQNNLHDCNGIIILYGSSTAAWVHRQLLACRKILSTRRKPLQAFAVFEGPPLEKSPIPLKLPNLEVLNFRSGLDDKLLESRLERFITLIKEG